MEIIVINKQRRERISMSKIRTMVRKLSSLVLSDLIKNKPAWIKANMLKAVEKRASLNLIFVSKQVIRNLNKKWLGKDRATDVLSFPLLDLSVPETRQAKNKKESWGMEKEDGEPLGEIYIAYEKACQQAREYNHSLERELAFLFVHGLLHIFGFDHQDQASQTDMFSRQRRILQQARYER